MECSFNFSKDKITFSKTNKFSSKLAN